MIGQLSGTLGQLGVSRKPVSAPQPTEWWLEGGINPANCMCAYQAIGASSYAQSLVNLNNPGVDNARKYKTNDPTWTSTNGWYFDGSGSNLLQCGDAKSRQGWAQFIRVKNIIDTTNIILGHPNAAFSIYGNRGGYLYFKFPKKNISISPSLVTGTVGSTDRRCFRDGQFLDDAGSDTSSNTDITIIGGSDFFYMTGYVLAVARYNTALTDAQAIAVMNAMAAL